jgi:hypothetical protein
MVLVGDITLQDGTGELVIELRGFNNPNIGAVDFRLYFDPQFARVLTVAHGNLTSDGYAPTSFSNTEGWIYCGWAHQTGNAGDFILCTITFAPITPGGPSPFRISTEVPSPDFSYFTFRTTSNSVITPTANLGALTVLTAGTPQGHNSVPSDDAAASDASFSPQSDNPQPESSPNGALPYEPSGVRVVALTIAPEEVLPNQQVTVSATMCNTGVDGASRAVTLVVDGVPNESEMVSVDAGGCVEVVFAISRPEPGTYQAAIDAMNGEFTVVLTVAPPPSPPGGEVVLPPRQDGIATVTLLAIVGTMLILIALMVFFFQRD